MKQLRGSLMLLITALIWGPAFVAQSDGMKYVEPFTYNAVRTLLGGIVLLPVVFLLRRLNAKSDSPQHFSKKSTLRGGILCGVLLCTASSFQQFGIVRTSAGKAGFITALYVLIVPLLGLLLRKKQPKSIWLCAGAALCGFYLLCVREGFRQFAPYLFTGMVRVCEDNYPSLPVSLFDGLPGFPSYAEAVGLNSETIHGFL